jgi:hypothetical protein
LLPWRSALPVRELDRRLRRLEASVPRPRPHPPELGAEAREAVDACIAQMLAPLPAPDSPDWTPAHHAILVEAAALTRRRWVQHADAQPGHDLLADPEAVVQVSRILREAGLV